MPEEEKNTAINTQKENHKKRWSKLLMIILVIISILIIIGGLASILAFKQLGLRKRNFARNFTNTNKMNNYNMSSMLGNHMNISYHSNLTSGNYNDVFISGDVTAISGNTVTIKGARQDYLVSVNDSTSYRKSGDVAKQSDLSVNENVLAVGTSNSQGVITAQYIDIR